MTTPHKATPEQWKSTEKWGALSAESASSLDSCLLELRDRIALLEATQHAHADASRMSDAEREQFYAELARPARIEALKTAASAPPDHVADASKMVATDEELYKLWDRGALHSLNLRLRAVYNLGRQHGATQTTCPHIISSDEGTSYCGLAEHGSCQGILDSSPAPAGGLVERVACAVCNVTCTDAQARAAILAVAEWLVEQSPEHGPVDKLLGQISTPFAVMADMLRDEVQRNA
jgi:hypothetical protein